MYLDWSELRKELRAAIGRFGNSQPDFMKGIGAMESAYASTGHLDAKTHELIALAVAVTTRCDGCLSVHAEAAAKHGATREEIAEALAVAITLNTGAALVYSSRALDAFDTLPK
ncbi:carboxymuconolactone decarboxylase family protein [Cronobacter turicensis]|nr:carboxymuconolactone decarboxylase family protein [Cronobacter turicensis]CCJ91292.1 Possible carboxymuconolactone decarboxylase family protein [Cronobacter turicensis 564]ELY3628526.1 carboxymuconolactone decarboxylase family protein [Cronobacter turicensis]ELY4159204.1 carboxymuconolactone decarboxylase family protein [Cronobacter turicensis]ELY4385353.1 carboxymuconolactone decarboxylase family protein [Cronobacter turicensis]